MHTTKTYQKDNYKYLLCACLVVFWDSDFSLLYFAQSCSELDLRALLYAFFLRLDSFLIVVFAQGSSMIYRKI
jgi:hypothetical protein